MCYIKVFFQIVIIISLILVLSRCSSSIDNIITDDDVTNFISNEILPNGEVFVVADTNFFSTNSKAFYDAKYIADTLKMKFWHKTDFNNDGITDLIAYGGSSLYFGQGPKIVAIISNKDSDDRLIILNIKPLGQVFPVVKKINGKVFLINYYALRELPAGWLNYRVNFNEEFIEDAFLSKKPLVCADTIIFKFDYLVEYNSSPVPKEVTKIEFEKTCMMSECEKVYLSINFRDRSYLTITNDDSVSFNYSGNIKKEKLDQIYSIINYLNFDVLKKSYKTWTERKVKDIQLYSIKIFYNENKKLTITDNGTGPYILSVIYNKLLELKNFEAWGNIKPESNNDY